VVKSLYSWGILLHEEPVRTTYTMPPRPSSSFSSARFPEGHFGRGHAAVVSCLVRYARSLSSGTSAACQDDVPACGGLSGEVFDCVVKLPIPLASRPRFLQPSISPAMLSQLRSWCPHWRADLLAPLLSNLSQARVAAVPRPCSLQCGTGGEHRAVGEPPSDHLQSDR
jgi:hypothetical protein